MKSGLIKFAAFVSLILGLATIFAGGSVILDLFGMRKEQGNYVLFVVWANFFCGFFYLISSFGFFKFKKWTVRISGLAVLILLITFLGLAIWIVKGNLYETKTVAAMSFRTVITIALWWVAKRIPQ